MKYTRSKHQAEKAEKGAILEMRWGPNEALSAEMSMKPRPEGPATQNGEDVQTKVLRWETLWQC